MCRRKIDIVCLQGAKWRGGNGTRNGVGIVEDRDLKDKIVNANRIVDIILSIKLPLEIKFVHVISAYTLQVNLDKKIRR